MKKSSFHVLRVGAAITFLWIGILILKEPQAWMGFVDPWVLKLLPIDIYKIMIITAILDIVIGLFLLLDTFVGLASLLGAIHMVVILTVSGINEVTVRDIAILAGCLALFLESLPPGSIALWCKKEIRYFSKKQAQ